MVKKWQITLAVTLMILGFMLSLQFKTQQSILKDLKQQKTEDLLALTSNFNSKNLDLVRQQAELKAQLESLKKNSDEGQTLVQSLQKDQDNISIALATKPVKGSGIIITLANNIAPDDVPSIVNDLWNSGAEAIALNDIRVNYKSGFSSNNHDVASLDGLSLDAPLVIKAIGPPDNLLRGITIAGRDLDDYRLMGDPADIKQTDNIALPAIKNIPSFSKAK